MSKKDKQDGNNKIRVMPTHQHLKQRQAARREVVDEAEPLDNIHHLDVSRAKRKRKPVKRPRQGARPVSKGKGSQLLVLIFVVFFVGAGVYFFFINANAYQVFVGDEQVATIGLDQITQEIFEQTVITRIESELGTTIRLNEPIAFRSVNARGNTHVTPDQAIDRAIENVTYMIQAGSIYVHGEYIATVASIQGANAIIEDIARDFSPSSANITDVRAEGLNIVPTFVSMGDIADLHGVSARLRASTREVVPYVVGEGDALWSIATRFGMSLDELFDINSGMDANSIIRPGDVLIVNMDIPFLTIHTEEELEVMQNIEPETAYESNPNQPVGFSYTLRQGQLGQVRSLYTIGRTNGTETSRVYRGTEILAEPVHYLIEVGTG